MNLSISQKGLVLVLLPLLSQLAFLVIIARFQFGQARDEARTIQTKKVVARAHEVHVQIADAHSAARGFTLTREKPFSAPLERAGRDLPTLLDDLDTLVRSDPGQSARATEIRRDTHAFLAWLEEIVQLAAAGNGEKAVERIRSGEGENRINDLRRKIGGLVAEEQRQEQEQAEALERSRSRLNALLIGGGIASVATTAALASIFRLGIGRRFAILVDNTRRLADGEKLPPPLTGGDEFARLDWVFRDMASALTEASDQVRDVYDNAPCGYHSVDADGTVIAINRTELRWLGYEASEVLGVRRFVDIVSPGSRPQYVEAFVRLKARGEVTDVELELIRRDGTTFPVLVNSSAVRGADGRYLSSRTTLTSLIDRKRAENEVRRLNIELEERVQQRTAELAKANADLQSEVEVRAQAEAAARESAARLQAIVETAVDGIITINDRGIVETMNPAAERMFGYRADEVTGRNVSILMPEPYRSEHDSYLANYLRTGERKIIGYGREVRGQHKDGTDFPVELAVSEMILGTRRIFTGLVRDITARKRAEEHLRHAIAELAEANRDLTQKNAENEMFVYSVSHDLRSPLVNLQGFSKELEKASEQLSMLLDDESIPPSARDRGRAILDGKTAKSIRFIQTAVLRLSNIIDALLRLSRAGRVEYRWEQVDVAGVASRVVSSLYGTISEKGAAIRLGDLPPAWGDRTAVEQVFANLLGNALTYLDPARPGRIEIGCLPPGSPNAPEGFRVYFVRDNGLGIPEGHRAKIFQAFQRAHSGVGSGEGLGLTIVARVVERHRGRVWVESRSGEGSTFFVALPATRLDRG